MIRLLLLLFTSLILAGCATSVKQPVTTTTPNATAAPIPIATSWEQRRQQLSNIHAWTIRGSTSIQQPNRTDMASMAWTQQGSHYNISLYGPLSLGRVSIQGGPGMVTLTQTNKTPASASSPEQLMQRQLGWQLPISNFYYWVRGIPAPGAAQMQRDDQNRLIQLNQQGWNIRYLGYMTVQGLDLPRSIELSNARLRIKTVIRNWLISTS